MTAATSRREEDTYTKLKGIKYRKNRNDLLLLSLPEGVLTFSTKNVPYWLTCKHVHVLYFAGPTQASVIFKPLGWLG
jgi:hypothetical protein